MTEAAEKLKNELASLPIEDRTELAWFLMDSLDPELDHDAEAAWQAELDRRWQDVESGKVAGIPMEKVMEDLRRKYP